MASMSLRVDKPFHDEYIIEGKIGEGTFGEVFLVRRKKDNRMILFPADNSVLRLELLDECRPTPNLYLARRCTRKTETRSSR